MTDRGPDLDPGHAGPVQHIDGNGFDGPYWQAGYRLGGYDRQIYL